MRPFIIRKYKSLFASFVHQFCYSQGHGGILARGAVGVFVVKTAGAGLLFGLHILLARLLGVEQYGIYISALTWINIMVIICLLGFQTSLVRFVAEYNIKKQWGYLRGILRISDRYVLGFSTSMSLAGAGILWIIRKQLSHEMTATLSIALVLLPFLAFCRLREACLSGFKQVVHSELLLRLINPALTGLGIIGFSLWLRNQPNAQAAMAATLISIFCTAIIAQLFLHKRRPAILKHTPPEFLTPNWLKVSLPLLLLAGGHIAILRIDILMLSMLHSSESAGIYAAACRVSNFVVFGYMAINAILVPTMSELYHKRDWKALQQNITRAAKAMFVFTLTAGTLMVFLSKPILGLFGSQFVSASTAFSIIIFGKIFFTFAGPAIWLMTVMDFQSQAALLAIFTIGLDIVLNVWLIPKYSIIGAAVATMISIILWQNLAGLYIFKKTKINTTAIRFP